VLREAQHLRRLVPEVERCARLTQEPGGGAQHLVDDLPGRRSRRDHGGRALQREEPLVLVPAFLEEAGGLHRDAELARHGLDHSHVLDAPVT
jgi:hypothetical protein